MHPEAFCTVGLPQKSPPRLSCSIPAACRAPWGQTPRGGSATCIAHTLPGEWAACVGAAHKARAPVGVSCRLHLAPLSSTRRRGAGGHTCPQRAGSSRRAPALRWCTHERGWMGPGACQSLAKAGRLEGLQTHGVSSKSRLICTKIAALISTPALQQGHCS